MKAGSHWHYKITKKLTNSGSRLRTWMTWLQILSYIFNLPKEVFTCPQEKMTTHSIASLIVVDFSIKCPISTLIGHFHIVESGRPFTMLKNTNFPQGLSSRQEKFESLSSESNLLILRQSSTTLDVVFTCWTVRRRLSVTLRSAVQ